MKRLGAAVLAGFIFLALGWMGVTIPAAAEGTGKLLMLLDASGSMKDPSGDGRAKIDVARESLNEVVNSLPSDTPVGMRVYGAGAFPEPTTEGCRDSQLVVPVGTTNRDQLRDEIGKYAPNGQTPIGFALQEAAKDLPNTGPRTILLVSDGIETCNVDPCLVAANLSNSELRIDVVGLNVDPAARKQLQCIAGQGKGQYADANNLDELKQRLTAAKERALRPFQVAGTKITGGSREDPPVIPAGTYVDTLPPTASPKYYRITRSLPNSVFWVGLIGQAERKTGAEKLKVKMTLLQASEPDTRCTSGSADELSTKGSPKVFIAGSMTTWDITTFTGSDCQLDDMLLEIKVSEAQLTGVNFQLEVREEPLVADRSNLPPAVSSYIWAQMPTTAPVPLKGGGGTSEAPQVQPGNYQIDIVPGEVQMFRVPLAWGQRAQALATVTKTAPLRDAKYQIDFMSPVGLVDYGFPPKGMPKSGLVPAPNADSPMIGKIIGAYTPEVRYQNRFMSPMGSLPGDFYLIVQLGSANQVRTPVQLTLSVGVFGEAGKGAPTFTSPGGPGAPSQPPAAPPPGAPETPEPTAGPTPESAPTSGGTESSKQQEGEKQQVPRAVIIGGMGAGALALIGAGTFAVFRLMRRG